MTDLDENKAVVRRFIDEVFVAGRAEAVDELVADFLRMMRQLGATPGG
jgi:hypothetical protein